MISYFKKMFDYDKFASHKILDLIISSGTTGKPVGVMAHMLAAQQIWFLRCKNLPAPGGPLWSDWAAEEMPAIIDHNHAEWMAYLNTLEDADIQDIITYKNLAGVDFSTILQDILAHVINHGTHHRGQVGALLKAKGIETPGLDYILYVRMLESR